MGGDFKQNPPIAEDDHRLIGQPPGGYHQTQFEASIRNAEMFKDFASVRLTQNIRVDPAENSFKAWLKRIGTGIYVDLFYKESVVVLVNMTFTVLRDLNDWIFPSDVLNDAENNLDRIKGNNCLFLSQYKRFI